MTHGDKDKAKAGKTSQASGSKSSSKAVVEIKGGENGKGSGKSGVKSAAESKASVKKGSSPPEKAGAASKTNSAKAGAQAATKGGDSPGKGGSKARGAAAEETVGFSNPAIADAFHNALEKYPNAFRRLTD